MKIIDCAQNSTAWSMARCGVVTASEADAILTPLFKTRTGDGVETYTYRKLAEKLLGLPMENGSTFNMDMGHMAEKIALPWFNFTFNDNARQVGFCVSDDGRVGCSPDGFADGYGLEIKFPTAPVHLKYLMNAEVPDQYQVQIHFSMHVTGFREWRFVSFSRQFTPLVLTVKRDEAIQEKIKLAVASFYQEFDKKYATLKAVKDAENAAYQPLTGGRD